MTTGVLPDWQITQLIEAGQIRTEGQPFIEGQCQPASLDLRLGSRGYRVRASFLPGKTSRVSDRLSDLSLHTFELGEGAVLETGCVYIVPLEEYLVLASDISATANPKSSTGRLDVFTRLITDYGQSFDDVTAGYQGPLYAEISPRSLPVVVRRGSRLLQLRLRRGMALLSDTDLEARHEADHLVIGEQALFSGGLALGVDLSGGESGIIGYRAKRHVGVIDVDRVGAYKVDDFWDKLPAGSGELVLDPHEFYILVSKAWVQVPENLAAEMKPFDHLVGEFRVHYAGFFDPGFGRSASGGRGSRAVLEVRSRDVPFILSDGQIVAKLIFEHLTADPNRLYGADLGSHYQAQGLKLSKHFYG